LLASSKSKSKKDIDAVIVYKLDRLTRSVVDLNRLIELFDKYDVALVSLVESLDATSASGRLMLNLLASVSQRNVKSLESGRRMLWHFLNQEIEYIHGRCMAIRLITVVTATA
jgi:DNA invertase Pin-like site-specific DNA recombinase